MTDRARPSFRRRLALGTALAGGTLLSGLAAAQELPSGATTVYGVPAVPLATGTNRLDVSVTSPATVINWDTFNVRGSAAGTPSTVNFSAAAPNSVVVNRVTGGGAQSVIDNGRITTFSLATGLKQNTAVWLLNPGGVLIGNGSVVNVGSFVGSTLDICVPAACSGAFNARTVGDALAAGANVSLAGTSNQAIQIRTGAAVTTTNTLVLVGGSVSVEANTTLSAGGDVNLVAASNVRIQRPGSPLVFQIDAGSRVAGDLMTTAGAIAGDSVVVAAARPDGLATALLSIGGTITARGVATDARGVVLLGGDTAAAGGVPGDPSAAVSDAAIAAASGNSVAVGISSSATLLAQGADVILNATGALTVSGSVSAARDYRATGASVTLGVATTTPLTQSAGRLVTVNARGGNIAGLGALTLQSNRAGATGGAVTLAAGGALLFDGTTAVIGGNGSAAGNADIRLLEGSSTANTRFGTITGRSLGRVPGTGDSAPLPLTLYGPTSLGSVTLDRALNLTIANGGGGQIGDLVATSLLTGANAADNGGGLALVDDLRVTAAGDLRIGSAESRTGNLALTATDGDVTGVAAGAYTFLTAASGVAFAPGRLGIGDGSIGVYAGRSSAGALTATGSKGVAQIATATAGNDVTVFAQKIEAGVVQAAAVSATPVSGTAPAGTATLHAFAHDTASGAVDLRVGSVSVGTGTAPRIGLDMLLVADAVGGTVSAGALAADRDVAVIAGNGANGTATIGGEVRAGRIAAIGSYSVSAGQVTLGTSGTAVEQSAAGAVSIRSTATEIYGFGPLTLQSNSDGTATEALSLNSARAIAFDATSRLFAGNGTAAGNSDLLVYESGAATSASFGQVRAARLGSVAGGATLFLYGRATFGDIDLDRSLNLYVTNGAGGEQGSLTTGALRLGVHPADGGTGTAIADTLTLYSAGSARFASVTTATGSLSVTANDGDVSGLASGSGGFDRLALSAASAGTAGGLAIVDGEIGVFAGRNGSGGQTATGAAGLALLGDATAGANIRVEAQAIDATLVRSDRGAVGLRAGAADSSVTNAAAEALTAGTITSGLGTTLAGTAGSVRVGTIDAGHTAVLGTSSGAVRVDGFGSVRIGVAAPTVSVPGGITSRIGDVAVQSQHGDITGGGSSAAFGAADLFALDGTIYVTADAQATNTTPVGLVQLGRVLAQTSESVAGTTTATVPVRGNIRVVGRAIEVARVETAGSSVAPAGGSLYLQAREGSPAEDVRITLGNGLVGTSATLIAGAGSLGGSGGTNGTVSIGTLEAGRNRLVGTGTVLPGSITVDATDSIRADTLSSGSGSVLLTSTNGDVGALTPGARPTITGALQGAGTLGTADGAIGITAGSPIAGRGRVTLGATRAGGDVTVNARAIDGIAQTVRSDRGSVTLIASAGDLAVGSALAGVYVSLDAAADPLSSRGEGNVTANTLAANRNVTVDADASATITDDVTAGAGGTAGYYRVVARWDVILGSEGTAAALADTDLQGALDDVTLSAGRDIVGARGLVLRSNGAGVADGTGDGSGVRELSLDAGRALALALPDGLTVAGRDSVATQLIGGSASDPRQSAIRARAGAGTVMTLGNVSARALRSIGATPVAATFPDQAGRAGADPLYHDGDIRVGAVDVAESLGVFAFGSASRLLQIDAARSLTGNVELVASGDIRGYQLVAPGGATPLGRYVSTTIAAGGARADVRAASVLLDDVSASAFADVTTTSGGLRVDTVVTGTAGTIADSGIRLVSATDLRLTSASAARGSVLGQATSGDVTGLSSVDDGSGTSPYLTVTRIVASDGNVVVNALGTGATGGLVAANTLSAAAASETPGAFAPVRGNLSMTGERIGVGTATAGPGRLEVYARTGGGAPTATGVVLGNASAGTTATVRVDASGASAAGDANGSALIGTITGGTNALSTRVNPVSGAMEAIPGTVAITATGNVRVDQVTSRTGGIDVTATFGDVTGLDATAGRAQLTAATAQGASGGAPAIGDGAISVTATGPGGLARLGRLTAGGDITVLARTIDATVASTTNGAILARASAADNTVAGGAGEALVLLDATSGLSTTLEASAGSVRASTLTAGLTRKSVAGDLSITATRNVRVDSAVSQTGSVRIVASDGDVTGLSDGAGGFGRATVTAGTVAPLTGSIAVYAGRDTNGGVTASGTNGTARLGQLTAGNGITVLAQAIDSSAALAGSGDIRLDSSRSLRVGEAKTTAGGITLSARDGDVTGLANATGFDRTTLTARGTGSDIAVYAGRDAGAARTASGSNGLALIGNATAARNATVFAEAIDATRIDATAGGIDARAFAADGAVPGTGGEALVVVDAVSGLGVGLLSDGGSVRTARVSSGLSGAGDIAIEAARNVRVGTARTDTGGIVLTARGTVAPTPSGDVTGLANATGYDRTILTAGGDIGVFAGRNAAGVATLIGDDGLALLGAVTAGRNLTVLAQEVDATTLLADRGALTARAYRPDRIVSGAAVEALRVTTAIAGLDATLSSGGSVRATTVNAGQRRTGIAGDLAIDAGANVTLGTDASTASGSGTGSVTITARGDVTATTLNAAVARVAEGVDAAVADGSLAIYAGRDAAGARTAGTGVVRLGTASAGNDVTILAERIDAGTAQAAAISDAPLAAGAASGTARLQAYGRNAGAEPDLLVDSVSAGPGSASRTGRDVLLTASAAGGTLVARTIAADRDVTVRAGDGANGSATLTEQVLAGRAIPVGGERAGAFAATAGAVTLGTTGAAIEQSARGAVAIVSTATDVTGLGTLTLQSNTDGSADRETLTLDAAQGILLPATSRLFGGLDAAGGGSDILVAEGAGTTLTTFGQVRGRSLGGVPVAGETAPVPLTLYGPTTFGTIDLDRSLTLAVRDGGAPGSLATGTIALGRYPDAGVADDLTVEATGAVRVASITSATGGASVRSSGASIVADGAIEAAGAIVLDARQDVTTTTVTSSGGGVRIASAAGIASGDRVTASGGALDIVAGSRAAYTTLAARDAATVSAGTIGVGSASAGTALTLTAGGGDTAAGEALVLDFGRAGTTAGLTASGGSVQANRIDAGQRRDGTLGTLTIAAARNVRVRTGTSLTGAVTVTARDGDVTGVGEASAAYGRADLSAAVATAASGADQAIVDGNVAVYAGRSSEGGLTATGANGLALLGQVSAGNGVTVLAQRIDAEAIQTAAPSAVGRAATGTATLTAYAHDASAGAVDLRVGSINAASGSATRQGLDVVLTAAAPDGTIGAGTINADRGLAAIAGTGTNGAATVTGAVRAGRGDGAGSYAVRAGQVTLGTAGQAVEQSAAAATTISATAGGITGAGALLLQSNRDGAGAETLEVRSTGGSILAPAAIFRGGQAGANGSAVTIVASGGTSAIDVGTVGAAGSTATLTAAGALSTQGSVTAATAAFGAGGSIITNGAVTAPTLTMTAGDSITANAALIATTATLRAIGGSVTTNAAVTAPTLSVVAGNAVVANGAVGSTTATLQGGSAVTTTAAGTISAATVTLQAGSAQQAGAITLNGTLAATTIATLRASGRVATTAALTAPVTVVQSAQIAIGAPVTATTSLGLYNQAAGANRTRLGTAAQATETGFELSQAEFDRIGTAALTIGSGSDDAGVATAVVRGVQQDVDIGALAIGAATGRTSVKVLGTGSANTIAVTGALTINGGTASRDPSTRVLQLGGAATGTTGEIGQVRVVNDGTDSGNVGRIATGGGVLDLRATRIVAGKLGFVTETAAAQDVNRDFVSNPNASLYGVGPNGYLTTSTPTELITTGQLRLQFSNFALLQNTSRPGAIPTGVTITGAPSGTADGQPLVLRSGSTTQANGFALFGRFQPSTTETFFSAQAALLGATFISNGATSGGGVNPVAARLNGCLLSSASGGCLAASIAQPTLNVFDVTRDQVLRGSDNLLVTFDPLVGSNNEALFGDIAAGDQPFDLQPCPDGTTSAQCKPSGTAKP